MMSLTGLTSTYPTVLFNAANEQIELIESAGGRVGVVRTYIHGTTLEGPVPTCLTGGDPPSGCPFDQIILLANHLQTNVMTVGTGAHRRNYGTTPARCPKSHRWQTRVTLYYADGSVDHVVTEQPCTRRRRA